MHVNSSSYSSFFLLKYEKLNDILTLSKKTLDLSLSMSIIIIVIILLCVRKQWKEVI